MTIFLKTEKKDGNDVVNIYCANAGDSEAVLCRKSQAVKLTCKHTVTDESEKDRINNTGGFIMGGRVNGNFFFLYIGVLAVTRSLGDIRMKEHVISIPYVIFSVIAWLIN